MTTLNKDKIVDTILIFFLTFFFAYPVYLCGINALDEGTLLHVAERITKVKCFTGLSENAFQWLN